ncbi:hypothetical protein [Alkalihalobacillus sp. AL-G]|uniref:hypothetical protein n=1 Tax=Alkalihalobacillus sp. AL-G TaxID=2926399 RepID=UPI00272C6DAB|nr:hypothetical protein [Alkalihalobacillus sp. AL-G]WLD92643.1 hypothetical protein MOJ78_16735 [Alkalihalobacillus sp. AL-G]
MATAGYRAQVNVSGSPVAFTNESTTANMTNTIYQINDPQKRVLAREAAITVEESSDGVTWQVVDPTVYTLNRLNGSVEFPNGTTAQVRLSGEYLPMSKAAEAHEYTYTLEADNQDVPLFGSPNNRRSQGLRDVTGSLTNWYETNSIFQNAIMNNQTFVIDFYSDTAKAEPDLRVWALISSDEASAEVDGMVEEDVEFEGTTDMEGRMMTNG